MIEGTAPTKNSSSQSGAGPGPVEVNVAPTSSVRSSSNVDCLFVISDATTAAEIRQCLKNVHEHRSLNSAKEDSESFRVMFPDSKIAQGYSQGRTKWPMF